MFILKNGTLVGLGNERIYRHGITGRGIELLCKWANSFGLRYQHGIYCQPIVSICLLNRIMISFLLFPSNGGK